MDYLKKLFRLYVKITCIVYAVILTGCVCFGEIDLSETSNFLFSGPFIGAVVVWFWLGIQGMSFDKTGEELRDEEEKERILAQARSEGAKQARAFARTQSATHAVNPAQVCPVCQGCGRNAAGYVCPVCNGSGLPRASE